MLNLPVEIIHYEIIKWLPNKDYYNLLQSNSAFNVLSENEINYRKYNDKKLWELCGIGDLNGVKYLISVGADVHAYYEYSLRSSAKNGHLEVVKYLVSLDADIHVYNDEALRLSAYYGHLEVVKYLISIGADIHANNDGALRYSAYYGHIEVIKYLVSVGANKEMIKELPIYKKLRIL